MKQGYAYYTREEDVEDFY